MPAAPARPASRRRPFLWWLGLLVGLAGLGLTVYLSLKTSSRMTTVGWLPKWLTRWADHCGQFRNFSAFGVISLPLLLLAATRKQRIGLVIALGLFITLLEWAQSRVPGRIPDPVDVFWGSLGVLTAAILVELFRSAQRRWRLRRKPGATRAQPNDAPAN